MANIELLPLIPLEDTFVFPNTVQKIPIHHISSSILVDEFFSEHQYAVVSLSKLPLAKELEVSEFNQNFIHNTGIKVELIQQTSLQNGDVRVVVEGLCRVTIHQVLVEGDNVVCQFSEFQNKEEESDIVSGLAQGIYDYFKEHLDVLGESAPDTLLAVLDISQPEEMADIMGSYLPISEDDKQTILEEALVSERLKRVRHFLNEQIIEANVNKNIDSMVQTKVDNERRDSLLRAKLRAIQNELKEQEEDYIQTYSDRLESFNLPRESYVEIRKEIQKLERASEDSSESNIIRSYLDFVLALPWGQPYVDKMELVKVQEMLDQYHYGLEDVKERILEYLAVRKLADKPPSNILCLAGPPGVGKTSIVKSVAKAMGRPFCRVALGGIRDEADLRGHRRTYVGALPGRIVSALYKSQSFSPVILLDEIDKMSSGFKGDPSSVLLEILDPEQNDSFVDHYMQVPVDLSNALFICTANDLEQIPGPLLNRLETIEITGYGLDEKLELATQYLVPDQMERHGLSTDDLTLSKAIITHIIADYTDDVGLRNLNRCFESIFRKIALKKVRKQVISKTLKKSDVKQFLGVSIPKPSFSKDPVVGRSVALYSVGMVGQILPIEVVVFKGTGRVISTGNIDPLLRETLLTALSYTKYNVQKFGLEEDYFATHDFHIHFRKPELLKQGEGWGLAIFAGILSAVRNIPLSPSMAFAGQISLLGKMLPTRDIEQKVLAAGQLGITDVVASTWNFEDKAVYVPEEVTVHKLEKMDQLLDLLIT